MLAALLLNLEPTPTPEPTPAPPITGGTGVISYGPTPDLTKAKKELAELLDADKKPPKPVRKALNKLPAILDKAEQQLESSNVALAQLSELTRQLQIGRLELADGLRQISDDYQHHNKMVAILTSVTIVLEKLLDDEEAILAILLSE